MRRKYYTKKFTLCIVAIKGNKDWLLQNKGGESRLPVDNQINYFDHRLL